MDFIFNICFYFIFFIYSWQPGFWPWHAEPRPHPPAAGDNRFKPAARWTSSKQSDSKPAGGQKWQHPKQTSGSLRLSQSFNVQCSATRCHLLLLLILTPFDLLGSPSLPVEEGCAVGGVCGGFHVLVGHCRDGASCRGPISVLLSLGVPSLHRGLPVLSPGDYNSSQLLVEFGQRCSAGSPFLCLKSCSDWCIWFCNTIVVSTEKHPGEPDLYLLHMVDQTECFQEAEHVLRTGSAFWGGKNLYSFL